MLLLLLRLPSPQPCGRWRCKKSCRCRSLLSRSEPSVDVAGRLSTFFQRLSEKVSAGFSLINFATIKTFACKRTDPAVSLQSLTSSTVVFGPDSSASRMRRHCSDLSDSSMLLMRKILVCEPSPGHALNKVGRNRSVAGGIRVNAIGHGQRFGVVEELQAIQVINVAVGLRTQGN